MPTDEAGLPVVVRPATYGDFRGGTSKAGYRFTVEHSIHVGAEWRNRGIGPVPLDALVDHARARGVDVMVAGIGAANEGSIRFHARHGFVETARMPEVGHTFGRWHDLVLMQRFLDEPGSAR